MTENDGPSAEPAKEEKLPPGITKNVPGLSTKLAEKFPGLGRLRDELAARATAVVGAVMDAADAAAPVVDQLVRTAQEKAPVIKSRVRKTVATARTRVSKALKDAADKVAPSGRVHACGPKKPVREAQGKPVREAQGKPVREAQGKPAASGKLKGKKT